MSACPRGVDVPASSFLLWEMAGDIPKLLGTPLNFWGHPKASEDASKLLGPGAHGNHSTLPEPTSGEQGCAPTVGDQPVGPDLLPLGTGFCVDPWGGLGQWADETEGLQGGQGVLGGSPGRQRDPQSCPHPPGINSCWERTEGTS